MNISVVRPLAAASMLCAMLCAAPAAFAIDSGDIVVDSVKGEVHVTMNGAAAPVRAGTVLELPATIRTGRDGALELRQGATTVSVGPETTLEFPALEERGGPIDRIVQPRGNAFYSIGKRAGRRLRVETPNLVGVIKGTQFNVAAQDESTTISLFEGLLEVHATDESSVIDLKAGEIASRKRGDKTISVIKMDGGKAPPASRGPGGTSGSNDNGTSAPSLRPARSGDEGSVLVDRGVDLGPVDVDVDSHVGIEARGGAVGAVGAGGANVATGVSGPAAVEVNTASNVNLGAGAIDVVANAKADTAALTTAASAVTAVNVAASNVSANVGVSTSTAVGSVAAVSTTAAAAADLGTKPSVAVSTAAATNVAGAAAAVTTTANVTTGNVDLGASVAGVNLNAAVDLGLGKPATTDTSTSTGAAATPATTTTTTTTTPAPVIDTSGLLDSLLHRSRKK